MKKIAVINSPVFEEQSELNKEDYLPPLGLGIISSSIELNHDVRFIDSLSDNLGVKDIIGRLDDIRPNFACINVFTTNFTLVKQIVENTEHIANWIIGGISTKSLYQKIFNWKTDAFIDVVYGDGENIVIDIIDSNVKEPASAELDNRRFYIVGKNSRYYADISKEVLDRKIFKNEPLLNFYGEQEVCIYTSRGCPFDCAYCIAASSRNKELMPIRRKENSSIIKELINIKMLYPSVELVRILDDLFLANHKSFLDAKSIFSRFRYTWRAMCHIKSIHGVPDDYLIGIYNSGCRELFIGIESGAPNILKRIHKTDDIDIIVRSVTRVLRVGINVKGYFICGFPDETETDLKKTLGLATVLTDLGKTYNGKFRNSTFQFRPYMGTELCEEIVVKKNILGNSILYGTKISENLNTEIKNKSFNFDSGNYSSVSDEILHQYIKKMNNLNE